MSTSGAVTLPTNVRPTSYRLTLQPDLDAVTVLGEETVDIEVVESTSSISLNSAELEVQSCRLVLSDGRELSVAQTSFDEAQETVTFQFGEPLPAGPATLEITFTGELNDRLRGFYRSRYTDESGTQRHLATTQFEATDARRAFPCWDEPARKATFNVALVVPSDMTALSNMPVVSESPHGDGLKRVEFAETPVMSTYLLAFVVGDLKSIESKASDGTLIRIWTTSGKQEQGRFALELSERLLAYFNDYFGIPYPLPKLDHIAIPDFAAGAMENWGAVTYREIAILVDPESSSAATRQRVATIISHEMAHMWFGDLVTMAWWNDLWLNESFASWMGDKAVDHLFPEWDMWTQFVSEDTNRGLRLDGLKSSHPIEQEVSNPAQIGELFDAISYSKDGSIIRMLERYLGPEAFRKGLNLYLSRHTYGNARTEDLWDAMGEASGRPVATMMDTWVLQTGYPVIGVETVRRPGAIEIAASQERFVYEHLLDSESSDGTLWHVPIRVSTEAGVESPTQLMDGISASIRVELPSGESPDGWVKVNPEQTGFYRVNYAADDWARLRPAVQQARLPAVDRLGIQNDAFALARAGYLPVTEFLSLAEAYIAETDATVWSDLAANLGSLDSLLSDEPYRRAFQGLGRRIFQGAGRRAGWEPRPGEGHLDVLLRSTVLTELGNYGDQATLDEAASRFARYAEDETSVPADLRNVVFSLAAKPGERSTYDTMWELQRRSTLEEEKVRLLRALAHFEQRDLLGDLLRRSLTEEVRLQNTVTVLTAVASNHRGRDLAWEFLKSNWAEYNRRFGDGGFALMNLVSITSRFTTQERLHDVQQFFKAHPTPAAERTIRQSLERIRLNIAWLDQNREPLADWF